MASSPASLAAPRMKPLFTVSELRAGFALRNPDLSAAAAVALGECAEWTATFPLQRVKKQHRFEAICPFVAPSIAADAMLFSAAELSESEPALERLDDLLRESAGLFERLDASDPKLRCLVMVVPGVRGGRLLEATDPARAIKNDLLRRGILVGEFFPSCPFATTFNPRLFALRSPSPMYVLRTFIETDWRFICQIPAWQATYRERFGEPPARLRHLGGPLWRFRQKISWRLEALRRRLGGAEELPAAPKS